MVKQLKQVLKRQSRKKKNGTKEIEEKIEFDLVWFLVGLVESLASARLSHLAMIAKLILLGEGAGIPPSPLYVITGKPCNFDPMKWLLLFCFMGISYFSAAQTKTYSFCMGDSFISPVCLNGTTVFEGLEEINGPGQHKIRQWCIDNGDTLARDSFYVTSYPPIKVDVGPDIILCDNDMSYLLHGSPAGGLFYIAGEDTLKRDPSTGEYFVDPFKLEPGEHVMVYWITHAGGVCPSSDTLVLTVKASPKVNADSLPALCDNDLPFDLSQYGSPSGGSWYSKTKPLAISGANKLYPSKLGLGVHWLTYKYTDNTTGCSNTDSQQITIKACGSGIREMDSNPFSIYPVPAEGYLILRGDLSGIRHLTLINAVGQEKAVTLKENRIDISNLPPGIFFIRIESVSKSATVKGIKLP
jgi:hypothetical protein